MRRPRNDQARRKKLRDRVEAKGRPRTQKRRVTIDSPWHSPCSQGMCRKREPVSESSDETKRQTILVVDDEAEVRALVREVLELHGYTVIESGDPMEAISPTTKILLMSGYETAAVKGSGRVLISKPFKTNDLVNTVRQLLDSKSAFRRPGPPPAPKPGFGPLAIALGALLLLAGRAAAAPAAPAFTVTLLDGSGHFDSRAHLGKHVLVVRFQASWCKVCNEEAAAFERVYKKYRASGVELVSVQVQDTEADARHFLEANKTSYPAGLDPRLKVANRFGFRGTPYTVVINTRGEMVARIHGRTDEARLARILDPLVKRAPGPKAPTPKPPPPPKS